MVLTFDADDVGKRHFEFCFVGFALGGSLQDKKNMNLLRREVAVFEKLEAISDLMPCGKKLVNGEPQRQLKPEPQQLDIEPIEFELLHGYISIVPWQTGSSAKWALETLDWLMASRPNPVVLSIPVSALGRR